MTAAGLRIIDIPADDSEGFNYIAHFNDFVDIHSDENIHHNRDDSLLVAVDADGEHLNCRAILNNASVTSVVIKGDEISVHIDLEFSWHYGCDNMCGSDTCEEVAHGVRVGDVWRFQEVRPYRRSTHDEF